ncbi:MAG: hypothetical protein KatS3mg028_1636 [Bacteroidia bacterium]|nr:MAG: hypothetical protein KatS3mg028_1636 [Bacteroidia bacterium]
MKFLCSIVAFLIFTNLTYSQQDWLPIGAKWHYQLFPVGFGQPTILSGFMTITVTGDTVIKGQTCKKLEKSSYLGNCTDEERFSFLYSDSNKVYWYNTSLDTFTLLYDFNAQPNDSWETTVFDCDTVTVQVDSVGVEIVNQDTLRVLYTSTQSVIHFGLTGKIIERIGSSLYLLPPLYLCYGACDMDYFEGLRCYEDTVIGLYESGLNPCDTIIWLGSENLLRTDNFRIYPNPATDELFIDGIGQPTDLRLYDLYGKEIFAAQLISGTNRIELRNLSSGLYIYQVPQEMKSGKIIIEK